jgi:hypothetical protein
MHAGTRYRRNFVLTILFEIASRFTPNLMNVNAHDHEPKG